MNAAIPDILDRALCYELCDLVVIGVLPDGGGLYIDGTASTVAGTVLMLEAAKQEAVEAYRREITKRVGGIDE